MLHGSQGRFSGKDPDSAPVQSTPDTILKDLDLDMRLKLPEEWHQRCDSALQRTGAHGVFGRYQNERH